MNIAKRYKNFHKGFTNPLVKQIVERNVNSSSADYVVLKDHLILYYDNNDEMLGGQEQAFAEEKFKMCNAAYESLCNKLSST
ncbi:hypothetical protein BUALT_Bualt12G0006700 [Buddleja alternifolia]|uniref:Uncharacterized protein n=1 Tax=Buddleja alternifolia TaxID=168488 RepID=A0AAV6WY65_9LAMI|nr:hypothetical protein BUALT_Bualt12G0006700 [Buddleja alternifolia]